jgi:drug/metabolite transporter (DMT)-like permease
MLERSPPKTLIVFAFAAVYVIWGSTYLAIRFAIESLPPFSMAGLRFLTAGTLLYSFLRLRGFDRPKWNQWPAAALAGGLMLVGGNGLVSWAEQTVPSGLAALLVATVPLWMVLLDWCLYHSVRPSFKTFAGLAFGSVGVILLIGPAELSDRRVHPLGAAGLSLACLLWSIGSLYSRKANLPKSAFLSTAMQMLSAGILLLIIGGAAGEWPRVEWSTLSWKSVFSLGYLIAFGSIVALSSYVWLLRVCSPAHVSTYAYVNPIVAVVLGNLAAAEPLTTRTALAAGLIVLAVLLVTTSRKPSAARRPAQEEKSEEKEATTRIEPGPAVRIAVEDVAS